MSRRPRNPRSRRWPLPARSTLRPPEPSRVPCSCSTPNVSDTPIKHKTHTHTHIVSTRERHTRTPPHARRNRYPSPDARRPRARQDLKPSTLCAHPRRRNAHASTARAHPRAHPVRDISLHQSHPAHPPQTSRHPPRARQSPATPSARRPLQAPQSPHRHPSTRHRARPSRAHAPGLEISTPRAFMLAPRLMEACTSADIVVVVVV